MIFLSSCNNKSEDTKTNADLVPEKITLGMYSSASYNPLDTTTIYNEQAFFLMYDSLFNITEDFQAEKNLASDVSIDNGGNTVTVQIKPNVKFHNGDILKSHDVVHTIKYIMEKGGYYAYNVRNFKSVASINDYTFKIELSYRTPDILKQLSFPIISQNENGSFNGTGPYIVENEKKGKQLDLIRFDAYHREFNSNVKNIEINLIPDKITARSLSGSGILDVFFAAFSDEGLKTVTKTESNKRDYLTDTCVFLKLNFNNPMLFLKSIRKAINIGVGRQKIATDVYMSHAEPTALPVPSSAKIYNSACSSEQKTEDAVTLLKESGYQDTDSDGVLEYVNYVDIDGENSRTSLPKNPIFGLLTTDDPIQISVAECLRDDFKKMGMILNIESYPKEKYLSLYDEGNYDICLITTDCGLDLDLTAFLGNGGIFSSDIDYKYDSVLSKLSSTPLFELKEPTYTNLFVDFYENPSYIPLVFLKNTLITNNKFAQFESIYLNNIYYKILLGKDDKDE